MEFTIGPMTVNQAEQILSWKYDAPYDFYNNVLSEETIQAWLDGSYHVIFDEKEAVFGFFCTGASARIPIAIQYGVYDDTCVDMGLGMNPNNVGKGYGNDFCSFIINNIQKDYHSTPIRLSVATFNKRAIHLYKRLGFVKKAIFTTDSASFMTMIRAN